jgi:hypothetical protein
MEKISAKSVWKSSLTLLLSQPSILLPFIFVALTEILTLLFLYLAPRYPVSILLAPPIRRFFGETYLHYPFDLVLLPRLFRNFEIPIILFVGSLMTGVMVSMIDKFVKEEKGNSNLALETKTLFPKYLHFFILTLFSYLIMKVALLGGNYMAKYLHIFLKSIKHLGPSFIWSLFFLAMNLVLAIFSEMVFVYSIPAVIIEKKSLFKAMRRSLGLVRKYFMTTLILVFIPIGINFFTILLENYTTILMDKIIPEISLLILLVSIFTSFLVNSAIVLTSTVFFLYIKKTESSSQEVHPI